MKKCFYISLALFINILFFFTSCSPSVSGLEYPHILSECEIQDMGITQKDETNSKENTMVFETKQGHAAYYYAYPVYDQGNNQATFTPQNTASEWLRLFPGHSKQLNTLGHKWLFPDDLNAEKEIVGIMDNGNLIHISYLGENQAKGSVTVAENAFGEEREQLVYEGEKKISFYSSLTGFFTEIPINDSDEANIVEFLITTDYITIGKPTEYYVPFVSGDENDSIQYIFQACAIVDQTGAFYEYTLSAERVTENQYKIKCCFSENEDMKYPATLVCSFEKYSEKAIIDSEANSKNKNVYLKSYSLLGNNGTRESANLFVRFSTSNLPENIDSRKIQSVKLRIKHLGGEALPLSARLVNESWCSVTLTQSTSPPLGVRLGEARPDDSGYYNIDITDLYKQFLAEDVLKITEYGVCISADNSEKSVVIPTADNSLYPIAVVLAYS